MYTTWPGAHVKYKKISIFFEWFCPFWTANEQPNTIYFDIKSFALDVLLTSKKKEKKKKKSNRINGIHCVIMKTIFSAIFPSPPFASLFTTLLPLLWRRIKSRNQSFVPVIIFIFIIFFRDFNQRKKGVKKKEEFSTEMIDRSRKFN